MANEPITREEMLLNAVATGEAANLEPITREEMFLAKLGGADVATPTPVTRKEQFLQKAIEGAGSGSGGGSNVPKDWFNDGDTHIWITLPEGRTSPMLGVCPKGTVTVDWGDGTTPDTLTGTSTSTVKWTPTHNYAKPGDYVITLTVDGSMGVRGDVSYGSYLLNHTSLRSSDIINASYRCAIQKVECGNGVSIDNSAFDSCYGLTSVVCSNSTNIIGNYSFQTCYGLTSVVFPNNIKTISVSAFEKCSGLASVVFPNSINTISPSAFSFCCVRYYDFTKHTAVPTLSNSNAFQGIASDCEIRVPAALYDEWIAATNWTTYASYIKAV